MIEVKCSYCDSAAVYHARHFGKSFCEPHLERYLSRKLRRNLQNHQLVRPGDRVAVQEDGSPAGAAAASLFRQAVEGWPVELVARGRHDKLLDTCTLECEAERLLRGLGEGEVRQTGYKLDKRIRPFIDFSSKALFTLGWLRGQTHRGSKDTLLRGYQGAAARLNLLRAWERMAGHR